ncbi:MAG: hypothetical protein GXP45_08275 [bacterium]|nr:hypothetical protein [bacterium]
MNGTDMDLMTYIKTLKEDQLKKLFAKFPDYLASIKEQRLENAYDRLPSNINKPITSVSFENNKLKINDSEIKLKPKDFSTITTPIQNMKKSKNIDTDLENLLKTFNANYDDFLLYIKK